FDVADARHPGADDFTENIEPHRIVHIDAEAFVEAALDRHFRVGRWPAPKTTVGDLLVRLEAVAVRDGVLARQGPSPPHLVDPFQLRFTPNDADDPGAQHRNELRLAGAICRI